MGRDICGTICLSAGNLKAGMEVGAAVVPNATTGAGMGVRVGADVAEMCLRVCLFFTTH